MTARPRSALAAASLVLAGACASAPREAVPLRFEAAAGAQVPEGDLRTAAGREIASFQRTRRAADLFDAAQTMEQRLRADGFARARVAFRMLPSEAACTEAVFDVDPGERASLGDVTFPGAAAFTQASLRERLRTKPSGIFGTGPTPYVRADLDALAADLRGSYVAEGRLRAEVGPPRVRWNRDRTKADVEISVVEGPRWEVAAVRIEGAMPDDLRAALRDAVDLRGKPWNLRVPMQAAVRARRVLTNRGHGLCRVDADATVTDEPPRATVRLRVVPGPVLRVREVLVEGEDRTDRAFIAERIGLHEGEVVTQTALDRAVDALYGTGVFRSARVEPVPPDAAVPEGVREAPADVRAVVEELDARRMEVEVGWGSWELLRGAVRYSDRNFLGAARKLDLALFGSLRGEGVEGGYEDRYLLGRDWVFGVRTGAQRREEPTFDSRLVRFETSVSKDLWEHVNAQVAYELKSEEATHVQGDLVGAAPGGFVRTAGIVTKLVRDTRDDPLFPSSGSVAELHLGRSAPSLGADLDFWEVGFSAAWYLRLGAGTVLALGAGAATRDVVGGGTLPVQERYFLGGAATVRSFGEDELSPVDRRGHPIGGLTEAEAHVELRQRLVGDLAGALFYDVGAVDRHSFRVRAPAGQAIGTGLRYHSPVGAVRLDVGWNPGETFAADRRWALYLSFGFSF